MATINYIDLTGSLSPASLSCPSLVMADAIRQTVIDLCERAQVWKYTHPDVAVTTPAYNYSFSPPDAQSVVSLILTARLDDLPIDILTPEQGITTFPQFPDTTNMGEPTALWQMDQRGFNLAPTPDIAYTLKLTTTLKPTVTSTGADATVIQEHLETIIHGSLHRLLLQKKREWYDADLAGYHGKQYSYKLNVFRSQAQRGFTNLPIGVAMRPFA